MVLFDNVAQHFEHLDSKGCDKVMRNGTAQAFAKSLYDQCLLQKQLSDSYVFDGKESKSVQNSRILHISVLCKALALILRCSDSELKSPNHSMMKQHLVASVPHVTQMMLALKDYGTLPLTTVRNAVRIMHRIAPLIDQLPLEFLKSTTPLLREELPINVRTDAALSLVCFLMHKSSKRYKPEKKDSDRILSILCVSVTASIDTKMEEAMEAFATLVASSRYFARLARRKCCILAATQNLVHENNVIRRRALKILVSIVNSHELDNGPVGIFASNMDYILQGLIQGATMEKDVNLFRDTLELLVRLVSSDMLPIDSHQTAEILTALERLATREDTEYMCSSEHAAICFLKAATKGLQNTDILCRVVEFATSTHASVRSHALTMVQDLLFWRPSMAQTLVHHTSVLASMSMTIRDGTTQERSAAMQICKTLVADQQHHCHFLECDDLLGSLIDFITSTATKDIPTLVTALDILLSLMLTTKRGVDSFLKSSCLLPWMVSLANRTSCSDLKARLVAAIQRMTLRLMEESSL